MSATSSCLKLNSVSRTSDSTILKKCNIKKCNNTKQK